MDALKEEDEKEDVMMMMESVLGPDLTVDTPVEDMELDSAISQLVGGDAPFSMANESTDTRKSAYSMDPFDGDVDKDLADVLGEGEELDDGDGDVDADIADALGSESSAEGSPLHSVIPDSGMQEEPQLDIELAELLEEPSLPSPEPVDSSPLPPPTTRVEHSVPMSAIPAEFETLGVGEPPAPPGDGSSVLLSEMDYLPGNSSGTLAFASTTTLPLATSALRSTTTPYSGTPGYDTPGSVTGVDKTAVQAMKQEDGTPALTHAAASPKQP